MQQITFPSCQRAITAVKVAGGIVKAKNNKNENFRSKKKIELKSFSQHNTEKNI